MTRGQARRKAEFLRRETENIAAIANLHQRMKLAKEDGDLDLVRELSRAVDRLNAERYALDAEFPDVCNTAEVST